MIKFIGYIPVATILLIVLTDIGEEKSAYIVGWGLWFFGVILFTGIFLLGFYSEKISKGIRGE